MNPTTDATAAIKAQVGTIAGGWANTDAQLAAALNAPSVANPAAQGVVPKPFTYTDVMGQLSAASLANLRGSALLPRILDDINALNRQGVTTWAALLATAPAVITAAEEQAIVGLMQATEPDPTFQPQLSWAQVNLGRPADPYDVYAARHA